MLQHPSTLACRPGLVPFLRGGGGGKIGKFKKKKKKSQNKLKNWKIFEKKKSKSTQLADKLCMDQPFITDKLCMLAIGGPMGKRGIRGTPIPIGDMAWV